MQQQFDNIRKTRNFLVNFTQELSSDQLNEIPAGFNNNIAWNLAHLVSVQQSLCYVRSGMKPVADEQFVLRYLPGSKPEHYIDDEELAYIRQAMPANIDRLEADYRKGLFTQYEPRETRYGATLNNIDDVIRFLPYHEGLHTGYIMALKRLVKK